MFYEERNPVCSENLIKHTCALCGQKVEFFSVTRWYNQVDLKELK